MKMVNKFETQSFAAQIALYSLVLLAVFNIKIHLINNSF